MSRTTYTPELTAAVCEHLAEGRSLRWISEQEGMPNKATILRWVAAHPEFRDQYVRAREVGDELLAEEILEIADDGTNDYMTITKGDKEYNVENKEVTTRSKIRIEARKWLLSKRQPKKYGDKLDLTSGGEKLPAAPRTFQILPASQRPPEGALPAEAE
ncbi:terminase small subunit-like protein [Hymenobacter metallilatus]|uniref:Terminase small subunit protein n=1 Tax=Hymenobacter metallilatus TaxID=2493666 RepID=A0A3R9N5W8_9BACT|nr:terminase small subunit protein [Hymenobacter metallilatus]RSK23958.1 terminase small subunit protein [Hymenobacter metallilatus]